MAKKKWTKVWLSRDNKGTYNDNVTRFWRTKPILTKNIYINGSFVGAWTISKFIEIYGEENLPDYGQCFEVEIEL